MWFRNAGNIRSSYIASIVASSTEIKKLLRSRLLLQLRRLSPRTEHNKNAARPGGEKSNKVLTNGGANDKISASARGRRNDPKPGPTRRCYNRRLATSLRGEVVRLGRKVFRIMLCTIWTLFLMFYMAPKAC